MNMRCCESIFKFEKKMQQLFNNKTEVGAWVYHSSESPGMNRITSVQSGQLIIKKEIAGESAETNGIDAVQTSSALMWLTITNLPRTVKCISFIYVGVLE